LKLNAKKISFRPYLFMKKLINAINNLTTPQINVF